MAVRRIILKEAEVRMGEQRGGSDMSETEKKRGHYYLGDEALNRVTLLVGRLLLKTRAGEILWGQIGNRDGKFRATVADWVCVIGRWPVDLDGMTTLTIHDSAADPNKRRRLADIDEKDVPALGELYKLAHDQALDVDGQLDEIIARLGD